MQILELPDVRRNISYAAGRESASFASVNTNNGNNSKLVGWIFSFGK
jgi:hypothetical protein